MLDERDAHQLLLSMAPNVFRLRHSCDDVFLLELLDAVSRPRMPAWPPLNADASAPGSEEELFADHDDRRGNGRGYYSQDERELRSRRIDLRNRFDLDRGPVEMGEPEDRVDGIELDFGGQQPRPAWPLLKRAGAPHGTEDELFADHDLLRGNGWAYSSGHPEELRARGVDLGDVAHLPRAPALLEMTEARDIRGAIELKFGA